MVRLLRERSAFEANLFEENNGFLVPPRPSHIFYALMGERNPRQAPKAGSRSPYSALACDAFELIPRSGPISKQKLQESLGGSVSLPALDRALGELWPNFASPASITWPPKVRSGTCSTAGRPTR